MVSGAGHLVEAHSSTKLGVVQCDGRVFKQFGFLPYKRSMSTVNPHRNLKHPLQNTNPLLMRHKA